MSSSDPGHPNQFALLKQRRFAPFFWTQFLGAGNDNLFKFAFTVMVTYQLQVAWLSPQMAGLVIGALFILPFLLFSATAGQATDKFDKTRVIRFVKNLEIGIMLNLSVAWPAVAENSRNGRMNSAPITSPAICGESHATCSWYVTITVNANLNRLSLPAPRNWVQKNGAKRRCFKSAN